MIIFLTGCVENGVIVQDIELSDSWFPEYVRKAFPDAWEWSKTNKKLKDARRGVQLISVRRLTEENGPHHEANLSWSTDGSYLGFEKSIGDQRTVSLKSLSGKYKHKIAVLPNGGGGFLQKYYKFKTWNSGLRWSYDSMRYVFVSNGGAGQFDIYLGSIGEKERAITKDNARDGHASWNPTRDEIAYVSSKSGKGDIYVYEIDTEKSTQLTSSNNSDLFPEWSPEGDMIFYSSGHGRRHRLMFLRKGDAGWGKPEALTQWGGDIFRPTLSPDGALIAFYDTAERNGQVTWNLHILPWIPGKEFTLIEVKNSIVARDVVVDLNSGPTWSPNGHVLFYVARESNFEDAIFAWDFLSSRRYKLLTSTRQNRDLRMSKVGVLSFRAQEGSWDRVYIALTNQGSQIQQKQSIKTDLLDRYTKWGKTWLSRLHF